MRVQSSTFTVQPLFYITLDIYSGIPVLRSLYRVHLTTCTVEPLFCGHSTWYIYQYVQWNPSFTVTLQSTSINIYSGSPVLWSLYRVHPSTYTVGALFYSHSTEYIHQHIQWEPCFTVTLQSTSINTYSGSPVLRSLYRVHPSTYTVGALFYGHSTEYIHQHVQWLMDVLCRVTEPCFTVTLQSTSINMYSGSPVLRSLYRVHPSTYTVGALFYGHSTEYIHQHIQWEAVFYSHSTEYIHQHIQWEPCFTVTLQSYIRQHIQWKPCFTVTLQSTSINIYSGSPVLQSLYRVHPSTYTVGALFYGHSTEYMHQHVQWKPCFTVTLQSTSINIYIGNPVLWSLYRVHPSTCTVGAVFYGDTTEYMHQHVQ